ncbi:MAG: hypothetical protein IJR59_00220 [Firmicutes bacterium]|nr:hypothetical protein [Bacillota bacterium]
MGNTSETLEKLRTLALKDADLRKKLIATKAAAEPIEEFCRIAAESGCPVDMGELLVLNEQLWGEMLKSTNGGATFPIED